MSPTCCATLDRAQRKVGRMILGFSRRCPAPVVLAELGWVPWSAVLGAERIRQLGRVLNSPCAYATGPCRAVAAVPGSWVEETAAECGLWSGGVQPRTRADWKRVLRVRAGETRLQAAEMLLF